MRKVLLFLSILMFSLPGLAGATLLVGPGVVGGSGDVVNVLFNGPGTTSTGNPVSGLVNGYLVDFASLSGEDLITPSQGQARIEAVDGSFDYLSIDMRDPNIFFRKIQFDINAVSNGEVQLTFYTTSLAQHVYIFDLGGSGENFFTGIATDELIDRVIIETSTGIDDLKQIRIGIDTEENNPVPEPTAMILFGSGLVVFGGHLRRRLKKS